MEKSKSIFFISILFFAFVAVIFPHSNTYGAKPCGEDHVKQAQPLPGTLNRISTIVDSVNCNDPRFLLDFDSTQKACDCLFKTKKLDEQFFQKACQIGQDFNKVEDENEVYTKVYYNLSMIDLVRQSLSLDEETGKVGKLVDLPQSCAQANEYLKSDSCNIDLTSMGLPTLKDYLDPNKNKFTTLITQKVRNENGDKIEDEKDLKMLQKIIWKNLDDYFNSSAQTNNFNVALADEKFNALMDKITVKIERYKKRNPNTKLDASVVANTYHLLNSYLSTNVVPAILDHDETTSGYAEAIEKIILAAENDSESANKETLQALYEKSHNMTVPSNKFYSLKDSMVDERSRDFFDRSKQQEKRLKLLMDALIYKYSLKQANMLESQCNTLQNDVKALCNNSKTKLVDAGGLNNFFQKTIPDLNDKSNIDNISSQIFFCAFRNKSLPSKEDIQNKKSFTSVTGQSFVFKDTDQKYQNYLKCDNTFTNSSYVFRDVAASELLTEKMVKHANRISNFEESNPIKALREDAKEKFSEIKTASLKELNTMIKRSGVLANYPNARLKGNDSGILASINNSLTDLDRQTSNPQSYSDFNYIPNFSPEQFKTPKELDSKIEEVKEKVSNLQDGLPQVQSSYNEAISKKSNNDEIEKLRKELAAYKSELANARKDLADLKSIQNKSKEISRNIASIDDTESEDEALDISESKTRRRVPSTSQSENSDSSNESISKAQRYTSFNSGSELAPYSEREYLAGNIPETALLRSNRIVLTTNAKGEEKFINAEFWDEIPANKNLLQFQDIILVGSGMIPHKVIKDEFGNVTKVEQIKESDLKNLSINKASLVSSKKKKGKMENNKARKPASIGTEILESKVAKGRKIAKYSDLSKLIQDATN